MPDESSKSTPISFMGLPIWQSHCMCCGKDFMTARLPEDFQSNFCSRHCWADWMGC